MGEYSEIQREIKFYEKYKESNELKTINVKRLFNIPFIHIKQSKYEKVYYLFNRIPICSIINYEGWSL